MMTKAENFLESVKDAINSHTRQLIYEKVVKKNNMIDNVFLLPDNNKDESECVKFARISSQEPCIKSTSWK